MNSKIKFSIIGVFVLLLGGTAYIASALEAKKVGDPCETYQSSQCSGPGAACLASDKGNYCSITCSADSDCPSSSGWKCTQVSSDTYSGKTGQRVASETVGMCVRP